MDKVEIVATKEEYAASLRKVRRPCDAEKFEARAKSIRESLVKNNPQK